MLEWINGRIFGVAVPVLLIASGIFFGFVLKCFWVKHPIRTLGIAVSGGVRSAMSALNLALAGTLGVGNIVGVAAAIATGGRGAIFWMWISSSFAMLLKYAEIVLAMRHRRFGADGQAHGSASYYISDCFARLGHRRFGAFLGAVFALFCILNSVTMGSVIQVRAMTDAMTGVAGIERWIFALCMTAISGVVIFRGRHGVMSMTEKIVPIMTLGYLVLSVAVLILRADSVPYAFLSILSEAFNVDAAAGGVLGFLVSDAVRYGTMRGLISNEAGCGTSPTAHSVCEGRSPASQGIWGIFEVFIDTILLCTLTALVIIVSGVPTDTGEFMMITVGAYSSVLGDWAAVFLAVSVLFFGFATVICWSHYGVESLHYFTDNRKVRTAYTLFYVASVLVGAYVDPSFAWQAADFAVGGMTVINVTALLVAWREIRDDSSPLLR